VIREVVPTSNVTASTPAMIYPEACKETRYRPALRSANRAP
jgi:hypothetical protein